MSDSYAGNSAPSADISSAAHAATNCSSCGEPPPDYSSSVEPPPEYSMCVSHSEPGSSSHHSGITDPTHPWHPISKNSASERLLTGDILHSVVSSAPFLDVTPASENRHDGYVPESNPHNSQPSYTANRPTTPRRNIYGKITIVRMRTDAQNCARKLKMLIGLCVGLGLSCIIPIIILSFIFGAMRI